MRTLVSISLLLGCSITAAAKAPSQDAAPPAGTSSSQTVVADEHTPANAPVTVTGCLRAGDEQNTFVLASLDSGRDTARNDTTTGAQSPAPTGTAGSTSEPTPLPKTMTYQLVPATSSADLRSHVGQRVQVSGTLVPDTGSSVSSKSNSAASAPKDARPADEQTPAVSTSEQTNVKVRKLRVESLKAVGGGCQ